MLQSIGNRLLSGDGPSYLRVASSRFHPQPRQSDDGLSSLRPPASQVWTESPAYIDGDQRGKLRSQPKSFRRIPQQAFMAGDPPACPQALRSPPRSSAARRVIEAATLTRLEDHSRPSYRGMLQAAGEQVSALRSSDRRHYRQRARVELPARAHSGKRPR